MSAWLVLSTLGFYPVLPSSGSYVLGAPQVRAARLQLAGGSQLRISATGLGPGRAYAKRAWLDSRRVNPLDLRHAELLAGRSLRFEMRAVPR
jgi:putative alpha-1,2-mannosidase